MHIQVRYSDTNGIDVQLVESNNNAVSKYVSTNKHCCLSVIEFISAYAYTYLGMAHSGYNEGI